MSRLSILAALVCGMVLPSVAEGQFGGSGGFGGSTGMRQNSGFGGQTSGMNRGGSNSGAFGSGGNNGGSMFGTGGGMFGNSGAQAFGGSSVGGGMGGNSATGTGGIQTGLDLGYGGTVGQNAFVGMANRNGGFVGDRRVGSGQLGAGAYGGGFGQSGFGRGGSRGGWNRGGDNDWRNGDSWWGDRGEGEQQSIRPTIRIGFEVGNADAIVSQPEFEQRYARIAGRTPELAGVDYEADGKGRVVLSGTVPDEEARDLAMALFRLEPGVQQVVDEMTLAPAE